MYCSRYDVSPFYRHLTKADQLLSVLLKTMVTKALLTAFIFGIGRILGENPVEYFSALLPYFGISLGRLPMGSN